MSGAAESPMKWRMKNTAMAVAEAAVASGGAFSTKRRMGKGSAGKRKVERASTGKIKAEMGGSKAENRTGKNKAGRGGTGKITAERGGTRKSKAEKVTAADSLSAAVEAEDSAVTGKRKAEKATAADSLSAVVEAEDSAVVKSVPEVTAVLSEDYVNWILARKPAVLDEDPDDYYNRMINDPDRPEVYTQEFLEEERQVMRDMAAVYKRVGDRFEKFQNWVRLQLKEKGYVEVGESYIAQRIMHREFVGEEQWKALMGSLA